MFSIDELISATGGRLFYGQASKVVNNISIDSRTIKPNDVFIAIKGANFDGHDFIGEAVKKGAGCIIKETRGRKVSGKNNPAFIEVKDTIRALADIGCFMRKKFNIPLIAVTGSNGKTTTKEMIAWVLSKKFKVLKNEGTKNNHIGLPLTLSLMDGQDEIAVVEIGSNHFGEIEYLSKACLPNIGVITNIGPSHLEYFSSLKGVFKEKSALIKNLQSPGIAVLNLDDKFLGKRARGNRNKPVIFACGIKDKADFTATRIRRFPKSFKFCVNEKYEFTLRTLGYYNIYNALATIAVARFFGMGYKDISSRLSSFVFPSGRLKITRVGGSQFIDDTYNANPLSLRQALDTLAGFRNKGRRIFIMGDMMELGRSKERLHRETGALIARSCDILISVGKLSALAAEAAYACGLSRKNIFNCSSTGEAQDILFKVISPSKKDVILIKGSRSMEMEMIFKDKDAL